MGVPKTLPLPKTGVPKPDVVVGVPNAVVVGVPNAGGCCCPKGDAGAALPNEEVVETEPKTDCVVVVAALPNNEGAVVAGAPNMEADVVTAEPKIGAAVVAAVVLPKAAGAALPNTLEVGALPPNTPPLVLDTGVPNGELAVAAEVLPNSDTEVVAGAAEVLPKIEAVVVVLAPNKEPPPNAGWAGAVVALEVGADVVAAPNAGVDAKIEVEDVAGELPKAEGVVVVAELAVPNIDGVVVVAVELAGLLTTDAAVVLPKILAVEATDVVLAAAENNPVDEAELPKIDGPVLVTVVAGVVTETVVPKTEDVVLGADEEGAGEIVKPDVAVVVLLFVVFPNKLDVAPNNCGSEPNRDDEVVVTVGPFSETAGD